VIAINNSPKIGGYYRKFVRPIFVSFERLCQTIGRADWA